MNSGVRGSAWRTVLRGIRKGSRRTVLGVGRGSWRSALRSIRGRSRRALESVVARVPRRSLQRVVSGGSGRSLQRIIRRNTWRSLQRVVRRGSGRSLQRIIRRSAWRSLQRVVRRGSRRTLDATVSRNARCVIARQPRRPLRRVTHGGTRGRGGVDGWSPLDTRTLCFHTRLRRFGGKRRLDRETTRVGGEVGEEVTDVRGLRGRSAQAVEESGVATILVGVVRVVQQLDVSRVTRINKGYLSLSGAFSHKKTMR